MIPLSKDDVVKIVVNEVNYKFRAPVGDVEDLLLTIGSQLISKDKEVTFKSIRTQNNEFLYKILLGWSSTKHKLPDFSEENVMLLQFQLSKELASRYVEEYTTSVEELKN